MHKLALKDWPKDRSLAGGIWSHSSVFSGPHHAFLQRMVIKIHRLRTLLKEMPQRAGWRGENSLATHWNHVTEVPAVLSTGTLPYASSSKLLQTGSCRRMQRVGLLLGRLPPLDESVFRRWPSLTVLQGACTIMCIISLAVKLRFHTCSVHFCFICTLSIRQEVGLRLFQWLHVMTHGIPFSFL